MPNRNGCKHLSYSLSSFARTIYPAYKVLIVDDASTDDSYNYVCTNFPQVNIIRNPDNKGFAGSSNVGIRWALSHDFPYIAICNNDIKVLPNWLEPIIEHFKRHQNEVGVIGYLELTRNQEETFKMPEKIKFQNIGFELPLHLCVFNTNVFKTIGLFDEKYFMYGEDSDLFTRMIKVGYQLLQSNIPVWHYGSGFIKQASFRVAWFAYRNGIRYAIKNCTVQKVIRQVVSLLYYGVTLALKHPSKNSFSRILFGKFIPSVSRIDILQLPIKMQRLRPSNSIVNFFIWTAAVLWNILFLPNTLKQRYRDIKFIKNKIG